MTINKLIIASFESMELVLQWWLGNDWIIIYKYVESLSLFSLEFNLQ